MDDGMGATGVAGATHGAGTTWAGNGAGNGVGAVGRGDGGSGRAPVPPPKRPARANPGLERLELLIRARHTVIGVESHEEDRVVRFFRAWAAARRAREASVYRWTATSGLRGLVEPTAFGDEAGEDGEATAGTGPNEAAWRKWRAPLERKEGERGADHGVDTGSLNGALRHIQAAPAEVATLFLFHDVHRHLEQPGVVRLLRDVAAAFRGTKHTLVLVSPQLAVPEDLSKDVVVAGFPLPDAYELALQVHTAYEQLRKGYAEDFADGYDAALREEIVRALSGLSQVEADNAITLGFLEGGGFTRAMVRSIQRLKREAIRRVDCLEAVEDEPVGALGGLDVFKAFVRERRPLLSEAAAAFGIKAPKGVVAVGVPGAGKSLGARVVGSELGLPVLRFNFAAIFGQWLGESEAKFRAATRIIEAVAPVVLWIDELGNAMSGLGGGGHSDGGGQTAERVFGEFLTWLQDRKAPVFAYFAANEIAHLPAQLTRMGRVDEVFFFDFPTAPERAEIFAIHLRKSGRDARGFDVGALAEATAGFVGAEIEGVIQKALIRAFGEGREVTDADLLEQARTTVPKGRSEHAKIQRMRRLVEDGLVVRASSGDPVVLPWEGAGGAGRGR